MYPVYTHICTYIHVYVRLGYYCAYFKAHWKCSHIISNKLAVVLGEGISTLQKTIQSCPQPSSKFKITAHNSENAQTIWRSWQSVVSFNNAVSDHNNIASVVDDRFFERVEEFKYLGTALASQNSFQEEIKSRLKSGNACYRSVQNLLSSSSLSKNLKIKIYRTINLPVVLYGHKTGLLTFREEFRLRVFENRVLRRIFGPKRTR